MKIISRRTFIKAGITTGLTGLLPCPDAECFRLYPGLDILSGSDDSYDITGHIFKNDAPKKLSKWSEKAFYFQQLLEKKVVCGLCPNQCVLEDGDRSMCRSRANIGGVLYTLGYGNPCSANVDPVEKKPLFHFKPQTSVFSIAVAGCNFRCRNCQNWEISQAKPSELRHYDMFPEKVVSEALNTKSHSIAYTYSEAVTWFEYMYDTSVIAAEKGLDNYLISNGYINPDPLLKLCGVLSAANINLKSFSNRIYRKLNGGRLQPVLNTLELLHDQKVHLEITHLLVPGYTDDEVMIREMCRWVVNNLGPNHPFHFLRFFPQYKLTRLPPTPINLLTRFRKIAMEEGIRYVYVGNVPGHEGNHTYCHNCKKLLIKRIGYRQPEFYIINGRCRYCKTKIPGVWE